MGSPNFSICKMSFPRFAGTAGTLLGFSHGEGVCTRPTDKFWSNFFFFRQSQPAAGAFRLPPYFTLILRAFGTLEGAEDVGKAAL